MSENKGTGQHYIECTTCSKNSKFYCNICHQGICEECKNVHLRTEENRAHEIVLYQDRLKELPPEKCWIHPTRVLELYCKDCYIPVCSKCFTTNHNGHRVLDLEVVYNESLKQCRENLVKIRDTILPQSIEKLKMQKEMVEDVKKEIAQTRLFMKNSADELKAVVDAVLTDNDKKLVTTEKLILEELADQEKQSEDYISYLQRILQSYNSGMSSNKPTEIITFSREMASSPVMKAPELSEPDLPEFKKGTVIKEEIKNQFGVLCQSKHEIQHTQPPSNMLQTPSPSNPKGGASTLEFLSSVTKVKDINIFSLRAVYHLSPLPSRKFWASDYKGNLLQCDMEGNTLQKIPTNRNYTGYHTVSTKDELLYTDIEEAAIFRVSSDMNTTKLITTEDWEPRSIYSSKINGHILVGMKKDKEWGETWKVRRYSKEGESLQDIQKDENGKNLYRSTDYITENINGDICTSDCNAKRLVVVTRSGVYCFTYSGHPSGSKFLPYGICTDVLGHILVCSSYNYPYEEENHQDFFSVHLLDQNGQFLCFLLNQCPHPPHALLVDDQHHLLVGSEDSSTVTVYKYLKIEGTS